MNKTKITLTSVPDWGNTLEIRMGKLLMLRTARKAGDSEVVNNYVLGLLRESKNHGVIDFIENKITDNQSL